MISLFTRLVEEKIATILNDDPLRDQFKEKSIRFTQTLKWEILTETYFNDLKQLSDIKNQISEVV